MKIFENPKLKKMMNSLFLAFIFYVVAAALFNGFFIKWGFEVGGLTNNAFETMYEGTTERPFVHRQLMITAAKEFKNILSEKKQTLLT